VTPDHPAAQPAHASPVAEQLQRGFPWLRFESGLEVQFWQDQYEHGLTQLRLNIVLASALVLAFIAMDRMVLPEGDGVVRFLRYGVLLPALAGCLIVTFLPRGRRWFHPVVSVLAPVAMTAVVALVLAAGARGAETVFPVVVLATIFLYYLVGLSFYGALRTNLVGLAAYVAGAAWVDIPVPQTSYQAMVLFFANLVGATVAYNLEAARRTSWLEARLLAEMADRDGLTGSYNRRRLDAHLLRAWEQGVREQQPMALLMIDIDCFKAFNDRYGHQAGDEALKAVAAVLARCARRPLDFVARYGGEEFLIVLYDTSRDYAAALAQQVLQEVRLLRLPHPTSSVSPVLTVSVGVAYVVPVPGRSVDGFVQLADEALYAAKHAGRDRAHVMEKEYEQLRTGSFRVSATG
jgi:diguanylate cyclase (GGDEF)-like protein